jgi:hypothetical protein
MRQQNGVNRPITKIKFIVFSLLPCLVLLGGAEVVARLAGLAKPSLRSLPTREEAAGMYQADKDRFWSLRPLYTGKVGRVQVTINSLGMRGPELEPKATNEFRILSLGESSTFGIGVESDQTYSAVLQRLLNQNASRQKFTVINAGVPAYSSFQSLKFLETRGLSLEPDLVLFYHEVNDYLPSALRDSQTSNEIGMTKTDRQLYESRLHSFTRYLSSCSALFEFLQRQWALHRIKRLNAQPADNPVLEVGLPDLPLGQGVVAVNGNVVRPANLNEVAIGRRVSEPERLQNFHELAAFCRSRGIGLVIIHPSYRDSVHHECILTRFCRDNNVNMMEAQETLHPARSSLEAIYQDSWHPTVLGHQLLGESLHAYLTNRGLLPSVGRVGESQH